MTARTLLAPLALTLGLLLLAACGGDGDSEPAPALLTDPGDVATATPKAQPPEAIILDPDALTPTAENDNEENGEPTPDPEVTPVTPFQITSEESTNLRAEPSTESGILGTINAGEEATVTGQVAGEAVDEGNDVWYQLEDGSFVYSGAVAEVEE